MGRYIFRRVLWFIPIMLGVSLIVFTLMYFSPTDAAEVILGANANEENLAELRHTLGLDRPFVVQYLSYIFNFFKGDMGTSYINGTSVFDSIMTAAPYSLRVGLIGVCLASILGITLGVLAATHQNSWIDNLSMVLALFFVSMPGFWFALLMVSLFAVKLKILPVMGVAKWTGYIMPCTSIALGAMARIARQTRSSMLEVIRQDYITTAKSKGQTKFIITYVHALKNALIPIITTIGGQVGGVLGAGLISETIFSIPGMGVLLVKAIGSRDYPVVEGCVLIISLFSAAVVLITDLIYALVNPHIKSQFQAKKKQAAKKLVGGEMNG